MEREARNYAWVPRQFNRRVIPAFGLHYRLPNTTAAPHSTRKKPPLKGEVTRRVGGVPELVKVQPLARTRQFTVGQKPTARRQPPFQGSL